MLLQPNGCICPSVGMIQIENSKDLRNQSALYNVNTAPYHVNSEGKKSYIIIFIQTYIKYSVSASEYTAALHSCLFACYCDHMLLWLCSFCSDIRSDFGKAVMLMPGIPSDRCSSLTLCPGIMQEQEQYKQ